MASERAGRVEDVEEIEADPIEETQDLSEEDLELSKGEIEDDAVTRIAPQRLVGAHHDDEPPTRRPGPAAGVRAPPEPPAAPPVPIGLVTPMVVAPGVVGVVPRRRWPRWVLVALAVEGALALAGLVALVLLLR